MLASRRFSGNLNTLSFSLALGAAFWTWRKRSGSPEFSKQIRQIGRLVAENKTPIFGIGFFIWNIQVLRVVNKMMKQRYSDIVYQTLRADVLASKRVIYKYFGVGLISVNCLMLGLMFPVSKLFNAPAGFVRPRFV